MTSCKGGVGKTTVAVVLALRRDGAAVGIFDGDMHGLSVPLMLGVRRTKKVFPLQLGKTQHRVGHPTGFIPIARSDSQPYLEPSTRFGLRFMSSGLWYADGDNIMDIGATDGHLIIQTIKDVVWGTLDYLIVDFPPGAADVPQALLRRLAIDGLIVVTTPQDMALMDTGGSLELFARSDVRVLGLGRT